MNGGRRKPSTRLRKGDDVRVRIPVAADAPERESGEGLVVLYEDDALVAIDKPAGVVAHPIGRIRHGTLINLLHARYRRPGEGAKDVVPRLAHRLDRDTSGVVLVVKDRRLDAEVTRAFFRREVTKTYWALVKGDPAADDGLIDRPIGPATVSETKLHMEVRPDGRAARTRWRVLERLPGHAWVELSPLTGRTHQLRVHAASIGLPDRLRPPLRRPAPAAALVDRRPATGGAPAADDDPVLLDRLALHAHRLALRHPVTKAPFSIESPLPADLARALEACARCGRAVAPGPVRSKPSRRDDSPRAARRAPVGRR